MNKILVSIMLLAAGLCLKASAQILAPVKWSYASKKISNKEAVIYLKASIENGWHIYSQNVKDGGPIKTSISFNAAKGFSLIGNTKEPKPVTRREETFNMDVSFFEHSVVFQQKIRLNSKQVQVKGKLEYMTCNDKQCLPPEEVKFSILVK